MTTAPHAPLPHRPVGFAAAPPIPASRLTGTSSAGASLLVPVSRPAATSPARSGPLSDAVPLIPARPGVPAYAQAQPFLTFPQRPPVGSVRRAPVLRTGRSGGVLATRVAGLVLTALCALWPVWFAVMALAFGLGLDSVVGMVIGAVIGTVAIGWPVGFWFATSSARKVWPVLIALVPTFLVTAGTVWLLLGR
ncbi:hypothetical protein GCM10009836_54960 [Pseudonocardia ailaonensis]|uniref:Major facilitator superfamily (MFS) profile domain-containing protein n=1 Tax=Pseudonocardia ailaonensis TaxID=367279 RepID=A0ABN2NG19_9PSEU